MAATVGHDFSGVRVYAPARVALQPRLAIGTAGGLHEQQADQIADEVLSTASPAPKERQPLSTIQPDQRSAPAIVQDVLASPGQPLDPATRAFMEPRFGHDFSQVRVHSDAAAHGSARAVQAHAFTVGQHIVFGDGRLAPAATDGQRLLAHELTHVVQQDGRGSAVPVLARQPAPRRNFETLARDLAKKLQTGKRADVLKEVQALQPADLLTLETAALKVLPVHDAEPLRRVIRFVRVPAPTNQSPVTITAKSGVDVPKAGAKVGSGAVTVQTGLKASAGAAGSTDSAYALSYQGSDTAEMRWLQFAWREVVPEYAVSGGKGKTQRVPARGKLEHSGQIYHLTTDPVKPQWNTDTGTSASPFFEVNTTVNRSANELTMVDFPSPMAPLVGELFADKTHTPSRVVSHFHAATYLVRGMDVVYKADVDLTWDFSDATKSTLKSTATGGPAKQLDAAQRTRLLIQFPDFAYLPGPAVSAPDAQPEFDIVRNLTPSGSLTEAEWADSKRTNAERFADIAKLADAYNLVDAVTGTTAGTINQVGKVPGATLKPGLNLTSELRTHFPDAPSGETGYLDSAGTYHNPDLPIERDGPLPKIVIILGPNAFTRGKAYALATLRHEMTHALHEQLALGWLVKWRDEQPNLSFKDWLATQVKAKKLTGAEAAVIAANTGGDVAGTEVLAWTEGLVTSLPFIPAVDVNLVTTDATYPAAISALRGAGKNWSLTTNKDASQAALDRIRKICCGVLGQSQRDRLVAWIDFLQNPSSLKPTENATKLLVANFGPLKDFLNKVRDIARKPCPKPNP